MFTWERGHNMCGPSISPTRSCLTAPLARAAWLRTHWDALAAQTAAFYKDGQAELFLEELTVQEGLHFERSAPDCRHFGTPEYALHLSWGHQCRAGAQVTKDIEIFMGYAGTLLIDGKTVTVLLRHQWQRDRSLVQQAGDHSMSGANCRAALSAEADGSCADAEERQKMRR